MITVVFMSSQMKSLAFHFESATAANPHDWAPEDACFEQHGSHSVQHLLHLCQSELVVSPWLPGHVLQCHV